MQVHMCTACKCKYVLGCKCVHAVSLIRIPYHFFWCPFSTAWYFAVSVWEEVRAVHLHAALVEAVKAVDTPNLQSHLYKIL